MLATMDLWPTAATEFLDAKSHRIRTADSRATYDKVLYGLQKRHPDKRVAQFTWGDVNSFCCGPGLAPATQSQRRTVLISFFRWATTAKGAPASVAELAARLADMQPPPRRRVRTGNWLSREELQRVLGACDDGTERGARDRMIILICAWTGLRRTELAHLKWGDVDLSAARLTIVGKGEKPARVGFNAQLREVIFEWRARCAVGLGRPVAVADPVIPRLRAVSHHPGTGEHHEAMVWSEPAGRYAIYKAVRRRGILAGIPTLAPHDLRRTFASLLEEQADILAVSKALRHSNVGTTQAYLESNEDRGVLAGQAFKLDIAL